MRIFVVSVFVFGLLTARVCFCGLQRTVTDTPSSTYHSSRYPVFFESFFKMPGICLFLTIPTADACFCLNTCSSLASHHHCSLTPPIHWGHNPWTRVWHPWCCTPRFVLNLLKVLGEAGPGGLHFSYLQNKEFHLNPWFPIWDHWLYFKNVSCIIFQWT